MPVLSAEIQQQQQGNPTQQTGKSVMSLSGLLLEGSSHTSWWIIPLAIKKNQDNLRVEALCLGNSKLWQVEVKANHSP